jgi:hypothetical protein
MRTPLALIPALGLVAALASCGASGAPSVDVAVPADTTDPVGPYEVTAAIRGRSNVVDARLRWFVGDAASARNVPLVREAGTDRWRAGIPGAARGSIVRFVVEVYDDEGHLVVRPEPVDGLPRTYAFAVRDPAATDADAGEVDAGEPDAGEVDAGQADAGEADGGIMPDDGDAGEADAGDGEIIAPGLPDGG